MSRKSEKAKAAAKTDGTIDDGAAALASAAGGTGDAAGTGAAGDPAAPHVGTLTTIDPSGAADTKSLETEPAEPAAKAKPEKKGGRGKKAADGADPAKPADPAAPAGEPLVAGKTKAQHGADVQSINAGIVKARADLKAYVRSEELRIGKMVEALHVAEERHRGIRKD